MGVVCTAYDPKLDRKVALKLLREQAVDGASNVSQGRARLLREAQALAKLSHPNIITVHDVDTFEGQLYMAMEFVEGKTLKDWMQEPKRPWRETVGVFVDAGRGLAAAHAEGITHRDFKPANVLMGDDGRVRVVDFGLAKGREARDLEDEIESTTGSHAALPIHDSGIIDMMRSASSSELTQVGKSVGTPAYMAPEQHLGFGVGQETDQFCFCVSLYEALYGRLPFRGEKIEERFQNMVEGNVLEAPKDARVPARIFRVLSRGLASQTSDRFPSMDVLLAELSKDPAKRNTRIAMGLGALALAGAGVFGALSVAENEVQLCEGGADKLVGVWDDGRKQTIHEAFAATEKPYAEDSWTRVEAALDAYSTGWVTQYEDVCKATRVRGEQSDALLDLRMGCLNRRLHKAQALLDVYASADAKVVERAPRSVDSLEAVEECATAELSNVKHAMPEDPDERAAVAQVQDRLDVVGAELAAGRVKNALPIAAEAVEAAQALPHLPTRAEAQLYLARAHKDSGTLDEAQTAFEQTVRIAAESERADIEARAWTNLVHVVGYRLRRPEQGLALVLPAEAAIARGGQKLKEKQRLTNNVGGVYFGQGEYAKAEETYREALELAEEVYGSNSPRAIGILGNLASSLGAQSKYDAAEPFARKAYELGRLRYGNNHPNTAGDLNNLGNVLTALGRDEEACEMHEKALAIREKALPEGHPKTADSLNAVAGVFVEKGKHEEAEKMYLRSIAIFEKAFGEHPRTASANNNLGILYQRMERYDDGLRHHDRALEIAKARVKPGHPLIGSTQGHRCDALSGLGQLEDALAACTISRQTFEGGGKNHASALAARDEARVLAKLGRGGDAIALLESTLSKLTSIDDEELRREDEARVQFLLATLLWERPDRRPEALEFANDARATFAALQIEQLEDVETWLQQHRSR
jgi:tetratricopeptide (TPR) repeat protein